MSDLPKSVVLGNGKRSRDITKSKIGNDLPSQEQIANTCTREVKARRWPSAFDNLECDDVED